jgi:hypothetical protein
MKLKPPHSSCNLLRAVLRLCGVSQVTLKTCNRKVGYLQMGVMYLGRACSVDMRYLRVIVVGKCGNPESPEGSLVFYHT